MAGLTGTIASGTIGGAAHAVLSAAEPRDKVRAARAAARAWRQGRLAHHFEAVMPARPARPARPELLSAARMPKRGKGGSERGRIAMLHALAHIEFAAIDLAFDLIGRFGGSFPRAFVDEWIGVGADEAMHFVLLDRRLRALGSGYGALPAHDGLWEAAEQTASDVLARLAVVPMVLEARGLDVAGYRRTLRRGWRHPFGFRPVADLPGRNPARRNRHEVVQNRCAGTRLRADFALETVNKK
jgi:uncharacterized ferritin-like protein (DUF455 family)